MQFSTILLGLAATASAIDIRGHVSDGCRGNYRACANVNPNVCCSWSDSGSSGLLSVAVVAIPTNWRIRGVAWTGGRCSSIGTPGDSNGATSICLPYTSRGDRTGGSYYFPNRKRAVNESCPAEQSGVGKCEASAKADIIGFADGTEYSIAGLSDEDVAEIVSQLGAPSEKRLENGSELYTDFVLKDDVAMSGAGAEAMPTKFKSLRRSMEA